MEAVWAGAAAEPSRQGWRPKREKKREERKRAGLREEASGQGWQAKREEGKRAGLGEEKGRMG